MARRAYLWLSSRLSRRGARRLEAFVMFFRPRSRRRAAALAALTPEARLMCIAWGVSSEELADIRDRMAAIGGKRPERMLVVSDHDALFGKGTCHFEYVPSREEWAEHFPDGDYDAFAATRIEEIADAFRARRVVLLGRDEDPLLYALAGRSPAQLEEAAEPARLEAAPGSAEDG